MIVVGVALVLVGAALLVAEAHLPAGVLGVSGILALTAGAALAISGAGAGLAVVLAVVVSVAAVAALWVMLVARKALATRTLRSTSGSEALQGRLGVVRSWTGSGGQVLVDGALWRARPSWPEGGEPIGEGDPGDVERISGLTLAVRKAEEWEEPC